MDGNHTATTVVIGVGCGPSFLFEAREEGYNSKLMERNKTSYTVVGESLSCFFLPPHRFGYIHIKLAKFA